LLHLQNHLLLWAPKLRDLLNLVPLVHLWRQEELHYPEPGLQFLMLQVEHRDYWDLGWRQDYLDQEQLKGPEFCLLKNFSFKSCFN